jgi:hypothetical protein
MTIKDRPKAKRKPKFLFGVEQELHKKQGRTAQLNKFYKHRKIYG